MPAFNGPKKKPRTLLYRRLVLGINLILISVLTAFMLWDYYLSLNSHIREKKNALEEEAKILLSSVLRLKEGGLQGVQNFIDETCGAMQESTSPGHHIAVQIGTDIIQAHAHHRASDELFSAMQKASVAEKGIALIDNETIVVGKSKRNDVVVYVSEYLSNIKKVIRAQIIWRLGSIAVVGLLVVVIINVMMRKLIGKPLTGMVKTVQHFGQGNFSIRMPAVETKELGLLADTFDEMAAALQTADNDRKLRMEKAMNIQMNLLPAASSLTDLKFAYIFRPAAEVAGDYFDIIRLPDNTFLFCVADVVGHGVPAAMEAAMLKAVLKTAAPHESDPQKIIQLLHSIFSEETLEEDFATVMLVHWQPVKSILTYASAGHETGYLARSNGEILELNPTGPVLGIRELSQWSQISINVSPKDRIIMLTDGIIETFSPKGELFGRQRIIESLKLGRSQPINAISETLLNDIISFRGQVQQTDDITFLAVELE
jgi:sigma-B regulation protein RsbU (phosphoserine phosphatase)